MPNTKSAKKRVKTNERRRVRNRQYSSRMKTALKKAEQAIGSGDMEKAEERVQRAASIISRIQSKGVIHRNQAARRQSRLMRKLNKAKNAAAGSE